MKIKDKNAEVMVLLLNACSPRRTVCISLISLSEMVKIPSDVKSSCPHSGIQVNV